MTSRERILRWLLRSYPKAFHDAYREDLLEFFEEQHSDPRYRRTFGELRFYGVVINPLPYPEADRLLTMWHTAPGADIARLGLSFGTYLITKKHNRTSR